ncbi:MAG: hypothetical protein CL858_04445 [Cupriavidus sp.]|nr:hypothetical protein [Cupriavidus sp.]
MWGILTAYERVRLEVDRADMQNACCDRRRNHQSREYGDAEVSCTDMDTSCCLLSMANCQLGVIRVISLMALQIA